MKNLLVLFIILLTLFLPIPIILKLVLVLFEFYLNWDGNKPDTTQFETLFEVIRKRKWEYQHFPPYPNGWLALIESDKLKKIQKVKACGLDFAIWRNADGNVKAISQPCPNIQDCFSNNGSNNEDIYCFKCYKDKGIEHKSWKICEANEFIFFWFHAEGSQPDYLPLKVEEACPRYFHSTMETKICGHVQDIFENGADGCHFKSIHGSFVMNGKSGKDRPIPFDIATHDFELKWNAEKQDSGKKHETTINIKSHVLLFNKIKISEIKVEGKECGPAIFVSRYETPLGNFVVVLTVTPIEPLNLRIVQRFYCPSWTLRPFAGMLKSAHTIQFSRDVCIWNRKIDRGSPPFTLEESAVKSFRRYYNQFYSEHSFKPVV